MALNLYFSIKNFTFITIKPEIYHDKPSPYTIENLYILLRGVSLYDSRANALGNYSN